MTSLINAIVEKRSHAWFFGVCVAAFAFGSCTRAGQCLPAGEVLLRPDTQWDDLFTRDSGWTAGDIANSIELPDGRMLWLFGDSFIGPITNHAHAPGSTFVRNAAGWHPPSNGDVPPPHSSFHSLVGPADNQGHPTAWISPESSVNLPSGSWYWPMGDGLVVPDRNARDRLVLFVTAIGPSGNPDGMWNFRRVGGILAIIDNWRDDPTAWNIRQLLNPHVTAQPGFGEPARPGINWGAALVRQQNDVLVFGVQSIPNRPNQLVVARAPAARIDRFDSWRFHTADGWSSCSESLLPIASDIPDEFSIKVIPGNQAGEPSQLILLHNEPFFGHHMMVRSAPEPLGPWSPSRPVFLIPGLSQDKRLMTYAHKAHPMKGDHSGTLLCSYVINSSDFAQICGDASLYRPRFVRIPYRTLMPSSAP